MQRAGHEQRRSTVACVVVFLSLPRFTNFCDSDPLINLTLSSGMFV